MKKTTINKQLSEREIEDMMRDYPYMSEEQQAIVSVIIMMAVVQTIKAKLGFALTTGDDLFLGKSEAIFNAFALNPGGIFTSAFAQQAQLDTDNQAYKLALDNVK